MGGARVGSYDSVFGRGGDGDTHSLGGVDGGFGFGNGCVVLLTASENGDLVPVVRLWERVSWGVKRRLGDVPF